MAHTRRIGFQTPEEVKEMEEEENEAVQGLRGYGSIETLGSGQAGPEAQLGLHVEGGTLGTGNSVHLEVAGTERFAQAVWDVVQTCLSVGAPFESTRADATEQARLAGDTMPATETQAHKSTQREKKAGGSAGR